MVTPACSALADATEWDRSRSLNNRRLGLLTAMGLKLNRFGTFLQRLSLFRIAPRFLKNVLCGQERTVIAVVLLFSLAMVGLLWQMYSLSDDLARELVLQGAELQSVAMEEIRKYYSSEVIARLQRIDGVEVSHDYRTKNNAIPLPATMSIELGKRISERAPGLQIKLYSDYPYPWRDGGEPRDAFEQDALGWLRQHPDQPYYRFEQVGSTWRLRYAKADRMQASCVACHNSHPASPKKDWREGDVRGVLEVVRPIFNGASLVSGRLQTSFALIGVVGALGLTGLSIGVFRSRRTSAALTDLVAERTADLVAAKQKAEQSASEKAALLATVEAFFIRIDESGVVCEWTNQAEKLFGIPLTQAIGRPFQDFSIGWSWEPILGAVTQAIQTVTTAHLDKVLLATPDKGQRFLKLIVSPLCKDSGIDVVLMGEDITGYLLLEHDLAQAQKLESIGHLAAGIAHEINTPTQFVGDNIRFLSDSFTDLLPVLAQHRKLLAAAKTGSCAPDLIEACEADAQRADLDYLEEEIPKAIMQTAEGTDRIAKIVRAMKDFAHPDSDDKTPVDLNKAIESTVMVARNEWKYVADLTTDLAPDLPLVPCLLGRFNQVILNMIVNAAHAIGDVVKGTGRKGAITIASRRVDAGVEIRITDTGTGIPENIRHKIFDPFFTTKEVGKGTGQGLAIARDVVIDKHGGAIVVESQVGTGTTFIIRLPVSGPAGNQAGEVAA